MQTRKVGALQKVRSHIACVLSLVFVAGALVDLSSRALAMPPTPEGSMVAVGAEIFRARGCASCHGGDGIVLARVAVLSDDDIRGIIQTPPAGMPVLELSRNEEDAVLAFLRSLYPATPKDG